MRTTVTLDDDVAEAIRNPRRSGAGSLKQIVNFQDSLPSQTWRRGGRRDRAGPSQVSATAHPGGLAAGPLG